MVGWWGSDGFYWNGVFWGGAWFIYTQLAVEVVTGALSVVVFFFSTYDTGTDVGVGELAVDELADYICVVGWDEAEVTAVDVDDFDCVWIVAVLGVLNQGAVAVGIDGVLDTLAEVYACNLGRVDVWVQFSPEIANDVFWNWSVVSSVDDGVVCLPVPYFIGLTDDFFFGISQGRALWLLWLERTLWR